jgi:hypothetical protein
MALDGISVRKIEEILLNAQKLAKKGKLPDALIEIERIESNLNFPNAPTDQISAIAI